MRTHRPPYRPLEIELIATCELLRLDEIDIIRFCHEDKELQDAFEADGWDGMAWTTVLEDAYNPAGFGRAAIPASSGFPSQIYIIHRAAHHARLKTLEPFFELLEDVPDRALAVMLRHARQQLVRFLDRGPHKSISFPLTPRGPGNLDPIIHFCGPVAHAA